MMFGLPADRARDPRVSFTKKFADAGWLHMGGLFPVDLIDRLRSEVESQLDQLMTNKGGHRGYIVVGNERVMLSVKLQGSLLEPQVYGHPILLTVLRQLLGEDILIDSFTCVVAESGAREQRRHQDHPDLFPEQYAATAELPPYAITVVIPLVDLTMKTGTTRLFPGTHLGGEPDGSELPHVSRGDCFLFDYRLMHQGTANQSENVRPVLYVSYSRPWFTDISNFQRQPRINIDREDVRDIPREHWPLFRRIADKGAINLSESELFPQD
jgi:ectoine hydroxylase-related dioxygenase (phytanoyl-CoA dioxygenase family)